MKNLLRLVFVFVCISIFFSCNKKEKALQEDVVFYKEEYKKIRSNVDSLWEINSSFEWQIKEQKDSIKMLLTQMPKSKKRLMSENNNLRDNAEFLWLRMQEIERKLDEKNALIGKIVSEGGYSTQGPQRIYGGSSY